MDDIRASIAVTRARDWAGFRAALRDWSVAIFNFVYADARRPYRLSDGGPHPDPWPCRAGFRDANAAADQWQGYIPFDDLPHMYDPPSGYVASANQRIVPDDWQAADLWRVFAGPSRRAARPGAGRTRRAWIVAANVRLQNDVKNCRAERLCPHILRHLARRRSRRSRRVLGDWDYRYALTSIAPTLFEAFMALWQREVISQHLPERLLDLTHQQTGLAASLLEDPDHRLLRRRHRARMWPPSHSSTLATLRARLGDDEAAWQWGRIHQAHWHHPVGRCRVRHRPARGGWRIAHAAQHRRRTAAARREFRAPSTASWWISPRRIRSLRCRTSAIPACRAARTTATSSNPGCAATTTWCI